MRWFVRGDIDGFFGLAIDNLVQILLIDALCRIVLGFDTALISTRGTPVSLLSDAMNLKPGIVNGSFFSSACRQCFTISAVIRLRG